MKGEKDLEVLVRCLEPVLNAGTFVFCTTKTSNIVPFDQIVASIRETEGTTLILDQRVADNYNLKYHYKAAWITLKVHSSLDAIGLTALFSDCMAKHAISCNVVAGYYHDHIFVAEKEALKAIEVLKEFSKNYSS